MIVPISDEGICVQKKKNIGFPTFKLPASTKHSFLTDLFNILFNDFDI